MERGGENFQVRHSLILSGFFFFHSLGINSVKPSISSGLDAIQLIENLAGNFEEIVQYNRDNTAFEVRTFQCCSQDCS